MKLNIEPLTQKSKSVVETKEPKIEKKEPEKPIELKKSDNEEITLEKTSSVVVTPVTPATASIPVASEKAEEPNTLGKAIKFSNYDKELSVDNKETINNVSKSIANLENISDIRHEQRKLEEENEDDDDDEGSLKIMDDVNISIDTLDINSLN